jgi:hypothetical protein
MDTLSQASPSPPAHGAVKKFRVPYRERSPQRSRYDGELISNGLVTQRGTERRPFPTKNQFFHTFPLRWGEGDQRPGEGWICVLGPFITA